MAETYYELLRRPEWRKRRDEIIESAEFECQNCGARDSPFHVHHLYYLRKRMPWEYPDEALVCVCDKCHTELGLQDDELRFLIGHLGLGQHERLIVAVKRLLYERFDYEEMDAMLRALSTERKRTLESRRRG